MTDPMQEPGAESWRKAPVQGRSKRAEKSLARAARDLLAERPYAEIRVEEVARRAGISVGGFYGRFRGKSALLHLADIDFLDECLWAFDQTLPEEFSGTLEEILHRFVTVMVQQFRIHKQGILQAWRHADQGDAMGFRERADRFNQHVHGRLRSLLGEHGQAIHHPVPDTAINLAIFFASSAARDAVIRGSLAAYPISITEEELIEEIVHAGTRYLSGGSS
jgi:AcrR family transcriptional regulator